MKIKAKKAEIAQAEAEQQQRAALLQRKQQQQQQQKQQKQRTKNQQEAALKKKQQQLMRQPLRPKKTPTMSPAALAQAEQLCASLEQKHANLQQQLAEVSKDQQTVQQQLMSIADVRVAPSAGTPKAAASGGDLSQRNLDRFSGGYAGRLIQLEEIEKTERKSQDLVFADRNVATARYISGTCQDMCPETERYRLVFLVA